MQIKTIEKVIKEKLNEWLLTIPDEVLREEIKKSIIVTGGCITSLLLKEPVNDFDIYISNRKALELIINHYLSTVKSDVIILKHEDKNVYLNEIESLYTDYQLKHITNNYRISVNNLKAGQIKLFMKTAGIKFDTTEEDKYVVQFLSPNAISLSNDIQIIIRFYGDPEEIHKNYDFIHATNYFTFEKGLVLNEKALTSILTKQLIYQGSLYPVTSILRLKKFIKRGWNITSGEILKIIFQCSKLDLSNVEVLHEQLIGMDVAYFSALVEVLSNIDKESITFEYISEIIDRIFNSSDEIE